MPPFRAVRWISPWALIATLVGCELVDEPLSWSTPSGYTLDGAELRPEDPADHRGVVVFINGGTTPSSIVYDLDVSGRSWMRHLAPKGFRVIRFDPPGFGASDRPPEMEVAPELNSPLVRSELVVEGLEVVVEDAVARSGFDGVHLVCWSAGCTAGLRFAGERPDLVRSITAYGPTYGPLSPLDLAPPAPGTDPTDSLGAYRLVDGASVQERWDDMIPVTNKESYRPVEVVDTWINDFLASDPASGTHDPPAARAPNGLVADSWAVLLGRPPYDEDLIVDPTLILRSADDSDSTAAGCQLLADEIGPELASCVSVIRGTHYGFVENGRLAVWNEVTNFIEANL